MVLVIESQILALFDRYLQPINKSEKNQCTFRDHCNLDFIVKSCFLSGFVNQVKYWGGRLCPLCNHVPTWFKSVPTGLNTYHLTCSRSKVRVVNKGIEVNVNLTTYLLTTYLLNLRIVLFWSFYLLSTFIST